MSRDWIIALLSTAIAGIIAAITAYHKGRTKGSEAEKLSSAMRKYKAQSKAKSEVAEVQREEHTQEIASALEAATIQEKLAKERERLETMDLASVTDEDVKAQELKIRELEREAEERRRR